MGMMTTNVNGTTAPTRTAATSHPRRVLGNIDIERSPRKQGGGKRGDELEQENEHCGMARGTRTSECHPYDTQANRPASSKLSRGWRGNSEAGSP